MIVPSASLDPARPHGAVHHRRDGAVQALLHRRRAGAVAAGHIGAEVLPDRGHRRRRDHRCATAPSSRCSATSASATTSRPTPSPSPGSCSPRCSGSTATGCGSPSTRPTTRPRPSGATPSGFPTDADPAPGGGQLLGDGRDRVRAARARSCSTTAVTRYGAEGGPAHGGEERFVELYNLVFMQYEPAGRRDPRGPAPPRTSTPGPASSATCRCSRGWSLCSTPIWSGPSWPRPRS